MFTAKYNYNYSSKIYFNEIFITLHLVKIIIFVAVGSAALCYIGGSLKSFNYNPDLPVAHPSVLSAKT